MDSVYSIKSAQPGMCVAADIKDRSGRLLISASTILDTNKIRTLKSWGITEIPVKEQSESAQSPLRLCSTAQQDTLLEELNQRFQFNNGADPFVREFKRLIAKKTMGRESR